MSRGGHWQRRVGDGFLLSGGCLPKTGIPRDFLSKKRKNLFWGLLPLEQEKHQHDLDFLIGKVTGGRRIKEKKKGILFFFFGAKPNFLRRTHREAKKREDQERRGYF